MYRADNVITIFDSLGEARYFHEKNPKRLRGRYFRYLILGSGGSMHNEENEMFARLDSYYPENSPHMDAGKLSWYFAEWWYKHIDVDQKNLLKNIVMSAEGFTQTLFGMLIYSLRLYICFKCFVECEKPSLIIYKGGNILFTEIAAKLCQFKGIEFRKPLIVSALQSVQKVKLIIIPYYRLARVAYKAIYSRVIKRDLVENMDEEKKGYTVLIFPPMNLRYTEKFALVVKEFENRGIKSKLVASLKHRENMPEISEALGGISYDFYERYVKDEFSILNECGSLVRALRKRLPFLQEKAYHDDLLTSLEKPGIELLFSNWIRFFYINLYSCACYRSAINSMITFNDPGLMIVSNKLIAFPSIVYCAAKEKEIPVLDLQRCRFGEVATSYNLWRKIIPADMAAVWGEADKEYLERMGILPQKIVITGSIEYDRYIVSANDSGYGQIRAKFGIPQNAIVLTYMTQPSVEVQKMSPLTDKIKAEIGEMLRYLLLENPNIFIIVKLHPSDNGETERSLLKSESNEDFNKRVFFIKGIPSFEVSKNSDMLFTVSSTTGMEAILLGKPLIIYDLGDKYKEQLAYHEVAFTVRNEQELLNTVRSLLEGRFDRESLARKREHFLRDHFYKLDGKSADRVIALAKDMMKKS